MMPGDFPEELLTPGKESVAGLAFPGADDCQSVSVSCLPIKLNYLCLSLQGRAVL